MPTRTTAPNGAAMDIFADIKELAAYYSRQKPSLCATDETRSAARCKSR